MPLTIAFVLSLAFHLACYTFADWAGLRAPSPPPPRPVIEAMLILPENTLLPSPEISMAESLSPEPVVAPVVVQPATPAPADVPAVTPPPGSPRPLAVLQPVPAQAVPHPAANKPQPLFYPREAVLRGIEGEALVNVTLDAAGKVLEVRIERGSGHAILDDAALTAALSLKSLPGGGREVVLPVRFKLR